MDLHLSTDKVVSIKDAFFRYAVIVAGILTALGLNQWVESRQHARQGEEAMAALNAELLRNKLLLGKSLKSLKEQQRNFLAAEKILGEKTFDVPDLQSRARGVLMSDQTINLDFGPSLAALQHSAWDAAVASQSLQYIPSDKRVALARAYAVVGEFAGVVRTTATSDVIFARGAYVDMFLRGESKDALRLARAIREQGFLIALWIEGYQSLEKSIDSTLAGDAAPETAQAGARAASKAADQPPMPARP